MNSVVDVLSKREYLYRQYFESTHKLIHLQKNLTAHPRHMLLKDLKSVYQFNNPLNYCSESSRETYYSSLSYFHFMLFKGTISQVSDFISNAPINDSIFNEYLFFYFFGNQPSSKNEARQSLLKSQYRPMRKGVHNMLRLQGTGAVAMPIEIRLQILASSKDVIHSWAVPSAGIKIDCIPGYTSHRIMTFLVSGIY